MTTATQPRTWSDEAKAKATRRNTARRLYKRGPVTALLDYVAKFPDSSEAEFYELIKPPKRKGKTYKKQKKDPLAKFGRYKSYRQALEAYEEEPTEENALKLASVWDRLKKPYLIQWDFKEFGIRTTLAATVPEKEVREFIAALNRQKPKSEEEYQALMDKHFP